MIMTLDNQYSKQSPTSSFNYFTKHDTYDLNDNYLATRSVPGSRRNSNEGKNLFQSTLKPYQHDDPIDFLMKPPPRSFSIDVGSMHSLATNDIGQSYVSSLFFDDQDTISTPSFHPHDYFRPLPTEENVASFNLNATNNTSNYGLFASSDINHFETNLRKNSTRSMESLRSKSWAQFLESQQGPLDINNDVQAAFYGQPIRRFSHGGNLSSPRIPSNYTYSDLYPTTNAAANNNTTTTTTNVASALFQSMETCPQLSQYNYCTSRETCPYSHAPNALYSSLVPPSSSSTTTHGYPSYHDSIKPNHHLFALSKHRSSPSLVEPSRKPTLEDPNALKYLTAQLEEFQGRLYELCKDQNGCRFLQTKLEESSANINKIYQEIYCHFVDLMTDPFGNYLCQKLIEKCNDEQLTEIVSVIAPEFLKICLSMHGTRAVQKLIEYLATPKQIKQVTVALEPNVVALIKDLNGNHVIQKCLYKLSSEHNQFIYDTVSKHCIAVASHKHGCCVYQRCIDHASAAQKLQLIQVITEHALTLVQDPFGNYVVQYVLDLDDKLVCSDGLIRKFIKPVLDLSVQKFSSNVIEKCIRVARKETRRALIDGIIQHPNMEKFLRDSYANYVIQTCLDCAEQDQRDRFVECIRPLLPSIRNTPYGKRIHSKVYNKSLSTSSSTSTTRQRPMPDSQSIASMIRSLQLNTHQ